MKAIIIHATEGSPETHWIPWLRSELEKEGFEVIVPLLPTPEGQNLANWLQAFDAQVPSVEPDTALIGFSIGVTFALRLLERMDHRLKGFFSVSGFAENLHSDFEDLLEPFYKAPFDWPRIRKNAGHVRMYQGDDDPYVPREVGERLAENLGASLTLLPGGGHLGSDTGYSTFDLLASDVRALA